MKVQLHPDAEEELYRAAAWYEDKRAGLGQDLLVEIARWLVVLAETPRAWPQWPSAPQVDPPIRRVLPTRFPFAIGYQAFEDRVLILAFAHVSRRPFYWTARAAPGNSD